MVSKLLPRFPLEKRCNACFVTFCSSGKVTHTLTSVDTRTRDIASKYAATRFLEMDCLWLELLYKIDLRDLLNTQQFWRDTRPGKGFCLLRSVMQPTLTCRGSVAPNAGGRTCRSTVYLPD